MADERPSFRRLNFSSVIPGSLLQTLVIDVVCPYMIYSLLSARIPALPALLLVALFPLGNIVVSITKRTLLDIIGVGALFIIASTLASSYLHGNTASLLRYVLPIGLLGVVTLLSFLLPKPIFFFVDRYFYTHSHSEQTTRYKSFWWDVSEYRRMVKVMNTAWGGGQVLLALLLVGLFFTLPAGLNLLLQPFIVFLSYVVLVAWTLQYRSSFERRWTIISQEFHVETKEEKFLV